MKVTKISDSYRSSIVSEKATGLAGHFATLHRGSMPTQPTPMFKHLTWDQIKAKVNAKLDSKAKSYPRLYAYEQGRWSKTGPQGGYRPLAERMEDLDIYFSPSKCTEESHKDPEYQDRILRVRKKLFGDAKDLVPLSFEAALQRDIDEDKISTNSGLPDYGKRSNPAIMRRALQDAKSGKCYTYPFVLGSRSSRQKERFIFMSPMSVNISGKRFLLPIMDIIRSRKVPSFSAWEGFDEVELAFEQQGCFKAHTKFSMDYWKMDTQMRIPQARICYDIIAPIFQEKYRQELWKVMSHGFYAPVMIGMDKVIFTDPKSDGHGFLSGIEWTNPMEGIYSCYVHEIMNETLSLKGDQEQGDDGAGSTDEKDHKVVVDVMVNTSIHCGLLSQDEKQDVDDHTLHYLQRFFDDTIFIEGTQVVAGSYPIVLAMNAAKWPERFHDPEKWSATMEVLRWIMIAENCKHSPYFHDLVDLFIEGDAKCRMGLSIPGYFKRGIVKDYKVAKTINGFVPTYNKASERRSIEDFETVKYLKSLQR